MEQIPRGTRVVSRFLKVLPDHPSVRVRMSVLLFGVMTILGISYLLTGSIVPSDTRYANIFQGGLLLVVFGSLLLEDKYTRPLDALVNSTAAIVSLLSVAANRDPFWYLAFSYAVLIAVVSVLNQLVVGHLKPPEGVWAKIGGFTYQLSTKLGSSNIIFSIVFLQAVFSVYPVNPQAGTILIGFWGFYLAIWPLKIPHYIQGLFTTATEAEAYGEIVRVDTPNLIRVKLDERSDRSKDTLVACVGDGTQRYALPLYFEVHDDQVLCAALLMQALDKPESTYRKGFVYRASNSIEPIGGPIGIVRENSSVEQIAFETWYSDRLEVGQLIYAEVNGDRVYYQVVDGQTNEESFLRHLHGYQVAVANQLGTLDSQRGFEKFGWLPEMNTLVYIAEQVETHPELSTSELVLGTAPGSKVSIVADIQQMISHHTAILGVTGSGKTELAFTVIAKAVSMGTKVLCIDITGDYAKRLSDSYGLGAVELSISSNDATELADKLHAVETGTYGAGPQKADLKKLIDKLNPLIKERVEGFLRGDEAVGIFTMPSISNTQATLKATELYLSSVFNYARNYADSPQVLIVLEEAHTVTPESSTMGVAGFDAQTLVARMAQIALQGRKYRVGLLVISQRTATVSKTILTQCNTVISFASFDRTSEDFLSYFMGRHASRLSNLRWLEALAFGRGIKSQRPIIIQVAEKPDLNRASMDIEVVN